MVAEVEQLSEEYLDPERVDPPGVFAQRVVRVEDPTKDIEQVTVRPRAAAAGEVA